MLIKTFGKDATAILERLTETISVKSKTFINTICAIKSYIPIILLVNLISAIKNSELPIATIVEGKAMSCGAILLSFGSDGYRFVDKDATVMIHDVSSGQLGKVEEVVASAKETERLNEIVYKMMAQNCGKKDDYFLKLVDKKKHADWFLDAEECKKHGLANHLRVPKISVNLDVAIDLE